MSDEEPDPREAFESQVYMALSSSMRATFALWSIYNSLHTENAGGSVSWEEIEDNMWDANEAAQFAETYLRDETGVVAQYRRLMDLDEDEVTAYE